MAKVIVVYDSLFGNTKTVAESIIEGMKQVSGIETTLGKPKEVDLNQIADFDAILIGSPNHMSGSTLSIRRFIGKLGKMNLGGKLIAVFDTYMGKEFEKAVKKMEQQVTKKAPGLKLVTPGLSIMVKGMRGPIAERELLKCKEFGLKIANQLKGKA